MNLLVSSTAVGIHLHCERNGRCRNGFGYFLQSILSPLDSCLDAPFEGRNEEVDQADLGQNLPKTKERQRTLDGLSISCQFLLLAIGIDDCLLESLKSFAGDLQRVGADEGVIRCRNLKCFIRSELLIRALISRTTAIVTNLLPAVDTCSRKTKFPINAV